MGGIRVAAFACGAIVFAAWCAPEANAGDINVNINIPGIVAPAKAPPPPPPPPPVVRYKYKYYPSFGVYFEPVRGLWFYLEANEWRSGRDRPVYVRDWDRDYVEVEYDDDKPHRHHKDVVVKYPPGYFKKHEDNRRGDDDHPGKGKGKGKGHGKDRD